MPTLLKYCPAIAFGSTVYFLPPWIDIEVTRKQLPEVVSIPLATSAAVVAIEQNQPTSIALTCGGIPAGGRSPLEVLRWFETIWNMLAGRTFKLYRWSDRCWLDCVLESQTERQGNDPLTYLKDLKLNIVCPHSTQSFAYPLTFTDFASEYPYFSQTKQPDCYMEEPPVAYPVTEPTRVPYSGVFPGSLVTLYLKATGEDHVFILGGSEGSTWRVSNFYVSGCTVAGATDTTLVLSTVPKGTGGGSQITLTLAGGSLTTEYAEGYIDLEAGSKLYVYATAGGGHTDAQYVFDAEVQ